MTAEGAFALCRVRSGLRAVSLLSSVARHTGSRDLSVGMLCAKVFTVGLTAALSTFLAVAALDAAEVKVDPATTYQTFLGWDIEPWPMWLTPWQRERFFDEAVNELGFTRMRHGPANGSNPFQTPWEKANDDGDPEHVNWAAFGIATEDRYVETWIKPFKQRVEANGEKFELWISPSFFGRGSTGRVPEWLLRSPGEYAEYATSFLLRLKEKHGIEADHYVICNEPANGNPFQPAVVARMISTLGPELERLGLKTRIQFPDGVSAREAWRFITAVRDDTEIWRYITMLSYHLYGLNGERTSVRDFAKARGLPTGQTEYMGLTTAVLHDDMTLGGTSYWSVYRGGSVIIPNPDGSSFTRGANYWDFRQVMHYVRPGAVRVEAASDDASVRALAFTRRGRLTVVLMNDLKDSQKQDIVVKDLPAGHYGVSHSVFRRTFEELGARDVGADGKLSLSVEKGAVLTVYPHPGGNLPPTVTAFDARPTFLTAPASSLTLAASATDSEKDALAFRWTVTSQPAGAKVKLAVPHAASTLADGLAVPGDYFFAVTVSDRTHAVKREVKVTVFAGNQPPEIVGLHNRIPIDVTLPDSSTYLRAQVIDLEKDPLTHRWTLVKHPAGANAALEMPPSAKPGNMERLVTGMIVPGDYVFRFEASDGMNTVSKEHTVTVHPENRAPVIGEASAAPAKLELPASATTLAAKASDPDGDLLTFWWSVKSAPVGAKPRFAHPGHAATSVTGLSLPGDYVFTVTVIDRTKFSEKDVRLTVEK